MKAFKVEVLVLDFENYGKEQIELMLGNVRGLMCNVHDIQVADIGEWDDEHPLNNRTTQDAEFQRLFPGISPNEDLIAALKLASSNLDISMNGNDFRKLTDQIDAALAGAGVRP